LTNESIQTVNLLLVFVPLGILAEKLHWGDVAVFSLNFVSPGSTADGSRLVLTNQFRSYSSHDHD
jgi:hypothetical protein